MALRPVPAPSSRVRAAFTLIELIVVIVVMGVLVAVGAFAYNGLVSNVRADATTKVASQAGRALQAVSAAQRVSYSTLSEDEVLAALEEDLPAGYSHEWEPATGTLRVQDERGNASSCVFTATATGTRCDLGAVAPRYWGANLATYPEPTAWIPEGEVTALGFADYYWRGDYSLHATGGPGTEGLGGPVRFARKTASVADDGGLTVGLARVNPDFGTSTPGEGFGVAPSTTYRISMWLRVDKAVNVFGDTGFFLRSYDGNGNATGFAGGSDLAALYATVTDGEWVKVSSTFTTGPSTARIAAKLFNHGSISIGDTIDLTALSLQRQYDTPQ